MRYPRWQIAGLPPGLHHPDLAERIAGDLNISRITANLLIRRGVQSPEEGRAFLYPDLNDLHDPFLLRDMDVAVRRLARALETGEGIAVYGDYDVDGLAATALLHSALLKTGVNPHHYIPDRLQEGYGLNRSALESIAEKGVTLVITVDCGISAALEVEYASALGMDVIILDHHRPPEELPQAAAVVDPWRKGCAYPFKYLSGCGVAFEFVRALLARGILPSHPSSPEIPSRACEEYLDLVALATIADMVPMVGKNRILTKFGLGVLRDTPRTGLRVLLEESGFEPGRDTLNECHVGFVLAPRLNAAGRLGEVDTALRLLITDDRTEAKSLAERLTFLNSLRQKEESLVMEQALEMLEYEVLGKGVPPAVVLSDSKWHPGVIGIAASKLVELLWRPTVLISTRTGVGRGSARSIPGLDIFAALSHCREFFSRFGGHAQAAGFDMDPERIPGFRKAFQEIAASAVTEDLLCPAIQLEGEITLQDLDLKTVTEIGLLAPFGVDNPEPAFMLSGVMCRSARGVGVNGDHLKLDLPGGLSAIAFGGFAAFGDLRSGSYVDLAFTVREGEHGGFRKVEVIAKDIRPHEAMVKIKAEGPEGAGPAEGFVRLIDRRGTVAGIEGLVRCLEEVGTGYAGDVGAGFDGSDVKRRPSAPSLIYVSGLARGFRLLEWLKALGVRAAMFGSSLKRDSRIQVMNAFLRGDLDVLVVYGRPCLNLRDLKPHYIVLWDPPLLPEVFSGLCQIAAGGCDPGCDSVSTVSITSSSGFIPASPSLSPSGQIPASAPSMLLAYRQVLGSLARTLLLSKAPLRRDLVRIFKALEAKVGFPFKSRGELERRLLRDLGIGFSLSGLRRGLRVFEDMGLFQLMQYNESKKKSKKRVYVKIVAEPAAANGKKRLQDCRVYRSYLGERRRLQSWLETVMSGSIEDMIKATKVGEVARERIGASGVFGPVQEKMGEKAARG
ncbi:MAG TPA: single-stranded-DNA-specific exonuclease RecJ [Clostridia bacterium]|nr:single-stranded-DNA-specific exonuclease RecJ [Clostridia bacterium]